MKRMTANLILILCLSVLIAGCSTTNNMANNGQKRPNPYAQQMAVIMAAADSREMFFIEVSSPDNLISEKIMLATLEIGQPSTAVDQLVQLLSSGKGLLIGIVGKSQAINIVTVKRALAETKGKSVAGTVALIADSKEQVVLNTANPNPDIKLIYADKNALPAILPSMEFTGTQVQMEEYPDRATQLQQDVQSQSNRQMDKLLRNTAPKTRR